MNSILWERPPVQLSISRSELHVWQVNLDNINYQLNYLISLLSPEEIKRAKRFIFDRDRYCYQVTHSMKRFRAVIQEANRVSPLLKSPSRDEGISRY